MLDLINADRRSQGLTDVAWDTLAAQVGTAHAREMADNGYFSHWNLQGVGPDIRYALAGGADSVWENLFLYRYQDDSGRGAPINDWPQVIRDAQAELMKSPGHRQNILDAAHTHVGIGIAYNPRTGDVRVAQEFVKRYGTIETWPRQVSVGGAIELKGSVQSALTNLSADIAYEPFPQPTTSEQLATFPTTYQSPAVSFAALQPIMNGNRWSIATRLDHEGKTGYYHIRLWGQIRDADTMIADIVIRVQ